MCYGASIHERNPTWFDSELCPEVGFLGEVECSRNSTAVSRRLARQPFFGGAVFVGAAE